MNEVYLSLGSNLGNRAGNISRAIDLLSAFFKMKPLRVSGFIETEPWGYKSDNRFINAVAVYPYPQGGQNIDLWAVALLKEIKSIERTLGRDLDSQGDGVYHDRPIDIDIIFIDNHIISDTNLIVPHPRWNERDFVLLPLREVASEFIANTFLEHS